MLMYDILLKHVDDHFKACFARLGGHFLWIQ